VGFGALASALDGDVTVDVFLTACLATLLAGALDFLTVFAFATVFFAFLRSRPAAIAIRLN